MHCIRYTTGVHYIRYTTGVHNIRYTPKEAREAFDEVAHGSESIGIFQFLDLFELLIVIGAEGRDNMSSHRRAVVTTPPQHDSSPSRVLTIFGRETSASSLRASFSTMAHRRVDVLHAALSRHVGEDEQWRGPMRVAVPLMMFGHLAAASVCVESAPRHCNGAYCERYWVCSLGYGFLGLHCAELLLKAFALGWPRFRKHNKLHIFFVATPMLLLPIVSIVTLSGQPGVSEKFRWYRIMLTLLPTIRLLFIFHYTKHVLRSLVGAVVPSVPIMLLTFLFLLAYAIIGLELLGCVPGMEFGAEVSTPQQTYDTLDWSMVNMFTLYLNENVEPLRQQSVAAARHLGGAGSGLLVNLFYLSFELEVIVLHSLFVGSILLAFEFRSKQLRVAADTERSRRRGTLTEREESNIRRSARRGSALDSATGPSVRLDQPSDKLAGSFAASFRCRRSTGLVNSSPPSQRLDGGPNRRASTGHRRSCSNGVPEDTPGGDGSGIMDEGSGGVLAPSSFKVTARRANSVRVFNRQVFGDSCGLTDGIQLDELEEGTDLPEVDESRADRASAGEFGSILTSRGRRRSSLSGGLPTALASQSSGLWGKLKPPPGAGLVYLLYLVYLVYLVYLSSRRRAQVWCEPTPL